MRLISFGPEAGHHVDRFGSSFTLTPLMSPSDTARTVCLHLEAGGSVGAHDALATQLFCVVNGEGWVSGDDGVPHAIQALEAAHWEAGERHAAGTDSGMVVVVIEGDFEVGTR